MFEAVKAFLLSEDGGGAVEWIITITAGAIIAAVAYIKLADAPGNIGASIREAGNNAQGIIERIKPPEGI